MLARGALGGHRTQVAAYQGNSLGYPLYATEQELGSEGSKLGIVTLFGSSLGCGLKLQGVLGLFCQYTLSRNEAENLLLHPVGHSRSMLSCHISQRTLNMLALGHRVGLRAGSYLTRWPVSHRRVLRAPSQESCTCRIPVSFQAFSPRVQRLASVAGCTRPWRKTCSASRVLSAALPRRRCLLGSLKPRTSLHEMGLSQRAAYM